MRPFALFKKIIWNPLTWYPESPDQYADGLPNPLKAVDTFAMIGKETGIRLYAEQLGSQVQMHLVTVPFRLATATQPPLPLGEIPTRHLLTVEADYIPDLVEALLYAHRRSHEHDYEDNPQHETLARTD